MSAKAQSGQWEGANGAVLQSKQFNDLLLFFELAAMHSLSPDQKQDVKTFLPASKKDGPGNGWGKVSAFMSEVQERVEQHSPEAEDFAGFSGSFAPNLFVWVFAQIANNYH